jgi:hypothetical protein
VEWRERASGLASLAHALSEAKAPQRRLGAGDLNKMYIDWIWTSRSDKKEHKTLPQTSVLIYVEALDKAGLLTRYKDEKRVHELPRLMEGNPAPWSLLRESKTVPSHFSRMPMARVPCGR